MSGNKSKNEGLNRIITIIKEGKSTNYYYIGKILHREDGPAIESKTIERFFINGIEFSEKMFQEQIKNKK